MEPPIACTLSPDAYGARAEELAGLASRALRSREPMPDGERLVFADSDETERGLRAVIATEAACCAFLRMNLRRDAAGLVLEVAGPPEARPIIAALFA